jgi:Secretion system C-terminal sorting domain
MSQYNPDMRRNSSKNRLIVIAVVIGAVGLLLIIALLSPDVKPGRSVSGTFGNRSGGEDFSSFLNIVSEIEVTAPTGDEQTFRIKMDARNNRSEFRTDFISVFLSNDPDITMEDCMVSTLEFRFEPEGSSRQESEIRPDEYACLSSGTWYIGALTDNGFQGPTVSVYLESWIRLGFSIDTREENRSAGVIPLDRKGGRLLSVTIANETKHEATEYPLEVYLAPTRAGGPTFLQLDCRVMQTAVSLAAESKKKMDLVLSLEPMRIPCLTEPGLYDVGVFDPGTGRFVDGWGKVRITDYEMGVLFADEKDALEHVVRGDRVLISWRYQGLRSERVEIRIQARSDGEGRLLQSGIPIGKGSWEWEVDEDAGEYTILISTAGGKRTDSIRSFVDLSPSLRSAPPTNNTEMLASGGFEERIPGNIPGGEKLQLGNYPNPFSDRTTVRFTLPEAGSATVEIFDMNGRRVRSLYDGSLNAGTHELVFDAGQLSSGAYLCRLLTSTGSISRTMMLVR